MSNIGERFWLLWLETRGLARCEDRGYSHAVAEEANWLWFRMSSEDRQEYMHRLRETMLWMQKQSQRVEQEETALKNKGGLANVMGKWPGDESDDQIKDALDELN